MIGNGRLGSAIAPALRAAGFDVVGPLGRGTAARRRRRAPVRARRRDRRRGGRRCRQPRRSSATRAAPRRCPRSPPRRPPRRSASTRCRPSRPPAAASPAAAVPSAGRRRARCATATLIARRLGMDPFEVADADRAAYHAAASIASNFLVTIEAAAERVAAGAGLEPERRPRAARAARARDRRELGGEPDPERALTGPVARGDDLTVAHQRAAVAELSRPSSSRCSTRSSRRRRRSRRRRPRRRRCPREDRDDGRRAARRCSRPSAAPAARSGSSRRWASSTTGHLSLMRAARAAERRRRRVAVRQPDAVRRRRGPRRLPARPRARHRADAEAQGVDVPVRPGRRRGLPGRLRRDRAGRRRHRGARRRPGRRGPATSRASTTVVTKLLQHGPARRCLVRAEGRPAGARDRQAGARPEHAGADRGRPDRARARRPGDELAQRLPDRRRARARARPESRALRAAEAGRGRRDGATRPRSSRPRAPSWTPRASSPSTWSSAPPTDLSPAVRVNGNDRCWPSPRASAVPD